MNSFFRAYRLLNILSVDVAVGAVISSLFFAKIFEVHILPYGLICLGLTVWIIYTADHLIDARTLQHQASSERHRFHQRYFKLLFALLIVGVVIDSVQLFFIRRTVFIEGLALALVIIIYFIIQRSLKLFKEVIGAALYTGGVLLIPWSVKMDAPTMYQLVLIAQFAITALINLLLFSWYDKQQDEQDSHSSFATVMGESATKGSLIILFIVQAALAVVQFFIGEAGPIVVLNAMNAMLLLIFANREYFGTEDRYRLLGDAIFVLPLIYVLS
jgi:hypothetical protein